MYHALDLIPSFLTSHSCTFVHYATSGSPIILQPHQMRQDFSTLLQLTKFATCFTLQPFNIVFAAQVSDTTMFNKGLTARKQIM